MLGSLSFSSFIFTLFTKSKIHFLLGKPLGEGRGKTEENKSEEGRNLFPAQNNHQNEMLRSVHRYSLGFKSSVIGRWNQYWKNYLDMQHISIGARHYLHISYTFTHILHYFLKSISLINRKKIFLNDWGFVAWLMEILKTKPLSFVADANLVGVEIQDPKDEGASETFCKSACEREGRRRNSLEFTSPVGMAAFKRNFIDSFSLQWLTDEGAAGLGNGSPPVWLLNLICARSWDDLIELLGNLIWHPMLRKCNMFHNSNKE